MAWEFEYTDTFAGEANYSWVKRETVTYDDSPSDRALVRRAKAWAGITGRRCTVENYGDSFTIRPSGRLTVLFIQWVDDPDPVTVS